MDLFAKYINVAEKLLNESDRKYRPNIKDRVTKRFQPSRGFHPYNRGNFSKPRNDKYDVTEPLSGKIDDSKPPSGRNDVTKPRSGKNDDCKNEVTKPHSGKFDVPKRRIVERSMSPVREGYDNKGFKKAEKEVEKFGNVSSKVVVPRCDNCGKRGHTFSQCWSRINYKRCHNCHLRATRFHVCPSAR